MEPAAGPDAPERLLRDAAAYRSELIRFATRQLGAQCAAADDVVQDAYLHLTDRVRGGNQPKHPRGWLYAVVRSRCADERMRRARTCSLDDGIPGVALGPEDAVIAAAEGRWLLERVADLPDAERDAVVARLAGVPVAEAVGRGRSSNAVHQALFRGRARLRTAHQALWGAVAFPVRWYGSVVRRAAGSSIDPSAFRGSSGVVRAAVIGGTALAAVVGTGSVLHTTHHSPASRANVANRAIVSARESVGLGSPDVTPPSTPPDSVVSDGAPRTRSDRRVVRAGGGAAPSGSPDVSSSTQVGPSSEPGAGGAGQGDASQPGDTATASGSGTDSSTTSAPSADGSSQSVPSTDSSSHSVPGTDTVVPGIASGNGPSGDAASSSAAGT